MRQDGFFRGVDGDFHFIDWGRGGPLAHFSHATGFCAGVYTPLAKRLALRLRVLGMDDRGHGRTKAPAVPERLKDWDVFVQDLESFFEYLGEPVVAMGHSRGAVASLLLAVKRPDLIRALVLIDPTILPYSWMWWWFLARKTGLSKYVPIAARAAKRRDEWPDTETLLSVYKNKFPFTSWKNGFLEAYVSEGTEKTGQGRIRLSCKPEWEARCFSVCPHDVWRYVPRLQSPTLVLFGKQSDTFLKSAVRRFKANAPHAVLRGFDDTGHFVPMEKPDETVQAVMDFLGGERII
jgi:pimeloyl-ACP methyl ester carboxylesterase